MADLSREQLIEIVSIATNATKKENSGLVQDIKIELSKLSEKFTEISQHIAVIDERHRGNTEKIVGIEKHLERLNSKVATQEKINSDTALVLQRCVEGIKCIPDLTEQIKSNQEKITTLDKEVNSYKLAAIWSLAIITTLGGTILALAIYIYDRDMSKVDKNSINVASYETHA